MPKEKAGVQLPADLAALTDDQLAALLGEVDSEFDAQIDLSEGDPDAKLARATELADMHDTILGEQSARSERATQREMDAQALRERVRPQVTTEVAPEAAATAPVEVPIMPAAVTAATTQSRTTDLTNRLANGETIPAASRRLNPTLAEIAAQRPASPELAPRRRESVLVASADIPGVAGGSQLSDMEALVAAMMRKARALPVTQLGENATWHPVAMMQTDFRNVIDYRDRPEAINEVLVAAANPDALVAAGGWCSPSEISYDFYNIVCEDGILDLPTVGITRGGIRWPTSPGYSSIINNYWTWNETQDIAAVTGTGQSGTKTCVRVPCPGYNELRLRCDGFCLTVGNLMEDAFPELIANHMRLTMAGNAHRLNQLRIQELINNSTGSGGLGTAITGVGTANAGVFAPVLGAIELAAIDYREKYRMCGDAVLEVVLPRWLRGALRQDFRRRTATDLDVITLTDAQLMNFFDLINVRVQWVTDWQVGGSGQPGQATPIVAYPGTVDFMIFAAGMFVLGRGLQLNLGVVRDSVLNATNDHTGAWQEECWLIAPIGHESRRYTVTICPNGTTGSASLTACTL